MESVMYIMIYLLNDNYLPWCDIESRFVQQGMEFKDVLRERLEIEFTKRLFSMIPSRQNNFLIITFFRGVDSDPEECPHTQVRSGARLRQRDRCHSESST
jgi:hypothetical protein